MSVALCADADRLKGEGNEWFKLGKWEKAIAAYDQAIEAQAATGPNAVLYCNRAMASLKESFAGAAIADADEALKIEPGNCKAHYRRASGMLQLGKIKEALKEFRTVSALAPNDPDAQAKLKLCEKEFRRIQFEAAIAGEETKPASERVKLSSLQVADTYTGPRLDLNEEGRGVLTEDYVKSLMLHFRDEKLIPKRDLVDILIQALNILKAQSNCTLINVADDQEITVCGDTHGQYYDLLNIFAINGNPSPTNPYLFNGDFVDRGSYSLENVVVLLAWKALYPDKFFMSRGNHESLGLNRMYGFEGEVKAKYDPIVFELFIEVFHALPLCHLINKRVFVTHGGLFSKDGVTIDDIQKVNRFRDIPEDGIMCELLWSDPQPMLGRAKSKRGVGLAFGPDVTADFLKTNNLDLVVRSHEVNDEGFLELHGGKLITLFSAPNYCDQVGNKGAFLRFNGKEMKPKKTQFTHVKHPGKRCMMYSNMGGVMGM